MTDPSYVTPGHPTQAGTRYDCGCGECLYQRRQRGTDARKAAEKAYEEAAATADLLDSGS